MGGGGRERWKGMKTTGKRKEIEKVRKDRE